MTNTLLLPQLREQAIALRQPQIKRHNPRTSRKNTGDAYRGCLRVEVRRSMELYRQIEGWALGAMAEPPAADGAGRDSNREGWPQS